MKTTYLFGGTTDMSEFLEAIEKHIKEHVEKAKNPRQHGHSPYQFGIEIRPMSEGNPVMNIFEE